MKEQQKSSYKEEFKLKNKTIFDLFGRPFYGMPIDIRRIRKSMNKNASMIHEFIFSQFNSPQVRNNGYVHLFIEDFQEEFEKDMNKSSLYRSLAEIEDMDNSGILTYDLGKGKGKFYFIQNEESKELFERINSGEIKLTLDRTCRVIIVNNIIDIGEKINLTHEKQFSPMRNNSHAREINLTYENTILTHEKTEGVKKQPLTLNWSSLEADLEKITKEVNKEIYKESFHKEINYSSKSNVEIINENEMMNDDINKKIEKKEEDKISNFYLEEMIDLGIYDYKAKEYISKLSTDDIQKALDKLEAAKDSGHHIKNEGNFIRETLEAMIDPNFKPKFSIQEKETEVLNIPAPIKKDLISARENALNNALNILIPNFDLVIHQASTKEGDLLRKLLSKFQYCIEETSTEWEDINQERQNFTEKMKKIKSNPDNFIKEMFLDDYSNPFANKKNEDGKKVYDLFLDWFESI